MNTHSTYSSLDSILPLPRRAVPSPDEDLLSIIRRSASRMGYEDLRWLLRPEGNKWNIADTEVSLLSAKIDYDVLEHLLILSEEELYSHTLHRFASLLEGVHGRQQPAEPVNPFTDLMRLSPVSQSIYFLPIRSIRVCPLCLQEQECYDRLYWRLQLVFHCPHHRVRLLEKCPVCEAPIAANRQSPYHCPRCQQGDYRVINPVSLTSDNPLYLGELLLLKALGIALPVNEIASRSLASSPLSTLSGISYLYLLRAVTSGLDAIFSHQELFLLIKMLCTFPPEDLSPLQDLFQEKKAVVFLLFHWLFLAWPTHFSAFLDVWYSLTTPPLTGEHAVSVLSSSRFLFYEPFNPDDYTWLRQIYHEYHLRFRLDSVKIDYFRTTLNQLAQSVHLQQMQAEKASKAPGQDERPVYLPPRSLTPTTPYPWESLGSALSRAARKMNHPCPEQLLYRPPFTRGSLADYSEGEARLPGDASDTILAYFLQIPKGDVSRLTGSSLIASLGLPPYNFSRYWARPSEPHLRSWFRPRLTHRTKLCPYCVRDQQGYDRIYWNLRGVLSCPRHKVRLLEKCPVCLKDIPAVRSQVSQCPYCKSETYILPTEQLPEGSMLTVGTSLLLTMLHIPSSEASEAFKLLAPSPLLTVKPDIYFALLVELTEEIGSYHSYSQQQLLQLCCVLGECTISSEQTGVDPYAIDAEVLLFHTLFSHWPERFFTFLDFLYHTVRFPLRSPSYIQYRWNWLLTRKWQFITPDWLLAAFEEHEEQYRESGD